MSNYNYLFGSAESSFQDLTDGASSWAGDEVHLTSNATRVAATQLMRDMANGGSSGEPTDKRARLESVIPGPAAPTAKTAPQMKSAAAPAAPKPVLPPLWLSGQELPQTQHDTDVFTEADVAAEAPVATALAKVATGRGAGFGSRGGPRGGQSGRWGRW
jgi:hypothetical protein